MIISSLKKFYKTKNELFWMIVFAVIQTANFVAVHFFVRNRFVRSIEPVSKLLGISPKAASILTSILIGGLLVFTVIMITELIAKELNVVKNKLAFKVIAAAFFAVHLLTGMILWAVNYPAFSWLCEALAYLGGLVMCLPSIINNIKKITEKKREDNEPAGFFD